MIAVHGAEIGAAIGQRGHGTRDGFRDIEELEIDKDFLLLGAQPVEQAEESRRHEQFEADFVEVSGVADTIHQLARLGR